MEKHPCLVGHGVQGINFLLFEKTQASILSKTSVIGRKKIKVSFYLIFYLQLMRNCLKRLDKESPTYFMRS